MNNQKRPGFARWAVLRMLKNVRGGRLELVCPDQTYLFGEAGTGLNATVAVHNSRFFTRVLFGGNDGAGESFLDGDWSSPDLVAVIRLAVRNLSQLEGNPALTFATRLVNRIRHALRRNTVKGSRRNIEEHYDLSNDFFRLFLDRNMVYSSGVYISANDSLEDAQIEKIDRICRKLRLQPNDHVLEIGTGWGAFALHAARQYGCRVTTTTISNEQYEYSHQLFAESGAAGERIRLLKEDYRNLKGQFDKIVSIEMFEAVGLEFYDDFFGACDRLLKPDGQLVMQTINMNEQHFDTYRHQTDFIQQRIFPGSQLSSVREILASLSRCTTLSTHHLEDFGLHYAWTLNEWRRRFHDAIERVHELGFNERFCRMWDYYLAYCEGAFRERYIGVVQLMLTKNGNRNSLLAEPWSNTNADAAARSAFVVR